MLRLLSAELLRRALLTLRVPLRPFLEDIVTMPRFELRAIDMFSPALWLIVICPFLFRRDFLLLWLGDEWSSEGDFCMASFYELAVGLILRFFLERLFLT